MSKKQYIALVALQVKNADGVRQSIEPRSDRHSGLFSHDFDAKTEKRLLAAGSIRAPEGTEEYERPTTVEDLHDSRQADAEAAAAVAKVAAANAEKGKAKGKGKGAAADAAAADAGGNAADAAAGGNAADADAEDLLKS